MEKIIKTPEESYTLVNDSYPPMFITLMIKYLRQIGVEVYKKTTEYDPEYPYIMWDSDAKVITQTRSSNGHGKNIVTAAEEFMALFEKPESVTVNLNANYKAIIRKEDVQVGCQTFTHDSIKKLIEEYSKFMEE